MALEGAQPQFVGADDGDGFFFDGGGQFDRLFRQGRQAFDVLGAGDFGAALAQLGLAAELGVHLANFCNQPFVAQLVGAQQLCEFLFFPGQRVMLAADLHFFQLAQSTQPHVEDRFGLVLIEAERLHQLGLGLILGADDLDDLVEVEEDGQIAFQHIEARGDFLQPEFGTPFQHHAAMVNKGLQHLAQTHDAGHLQMVQDIHVEGDANFQVALAEQLLHQQAGIDGAILGRQDDADIFGAFVMDIIEQRQLFQLQQFSDALDQLGLLHLVGNFGDDDLIDAAGAFFLFPSRAQAKTAAAGLVGFGNAGLVFHHDAAGGEIGPAHMLEQGAVLDIGIFDQRDQRAAEFAQIVGRDGRRHANGDTGGTIGEQIWKSGGKNDGFFFLTVIGGAEIHRVFVQAIEQRLRHFGEAAFGVTHGGGIIAVHIAEIALAFDQRITQREILSQPHQCFIDRQVAMRMIFADDVAHDAGAFLETGLGIETQQAHGVHEAAMHRLEAVAHIGQGALGDGGEGIGEIAFGQGRRQPFGTNVIRFYGDAHGALLF